MSKLDPPPSVIKLVTSEYDISAETTKDNSQPDSIWKKWFLSLFTKVEEKVTAGYGGAFQNTDALFDVPATPNYNTMIVDTLRPVNQLGFSVDLGAETFTFTSQGVWKVNISFNLSGINELNQSRTFIARIYNVTDSVQAAFVSVPVSRNQGDVWFTAPITMDVIPSNVNKTFRVELGGGDAIAGGTLIGAGVSANRVDES